MLGDDQRRELDLGLRTKARLIAETRRKKTGTETANRPREGRSGMDTRLDVDPSPLERGGRLVSSNPADSNRSVSWRSNRRRNRALGLDRFGRPLARVAGTNPRALGTNPKETRDSGGVNIVSHWRNG
jgi:hypothetical protein